MNNELRLSDESTAPEGRNINSPGLKPRGKGNIQKTLQAINRYEQKYYMQQKRLRLKTASKEQCKNLN